MSTLAETETPDTEAPEAPETGEPGQEADEPEPGTGEPEGPNGEPTEAFSEKDVQTAMDKLDREHKRHAERISQIMGEDALVLVPCELCAPSIAGFRWPIEQPDDVKHAVRKAIGDAEPEDYKVSPDAMLCDACAGLGRQLTGSKVPEHRTKVCATCNGAGWLDKTRPPGAVVPQSLDAGRAPIDTPPPDNIPDVDPFGRPRGDPNFGIFPGYEAGR